MSKERVGRRFEFLFWEVSRRRSVVLTEIIDDAVVAEPEPISEYLCGVAGFALVAREDAAHPSCPGMGDHRPPAGLAALVERPFGNRHARIDSDIRMGDEENRRHRIFAPPRTRTLSHMPPRSEE